VMLGSGANLLGYYMFHGGSNPEGGSTTLQESQRTGYPTDVPVKSYDFQAPLGEFGQERASLRKLKLIHYFLNDFGADLAPMAPRAPSQVATGPADLTTPRVSARTKGDAGFLFLNNYVRGARMPDRPGFQVELRLPSGVVRIPERPVDLPSGVYGIWPVNFTLPEGSIRYSTAQLFKREIVGDQTFYFFFAIPGIQPEILLDRRTRLLDRPATVEANAGDNGTRLRFNVASSTEVRLAGGVHLIVLPEALAEQVWRADDPSVLVATRASFFCDGSRWTFDSLGNNEGSSAAEPEIEFSTFGRTGEPIHASPALQKTASDGIFQGYKAALPSIDLKPRVTLLREAQPPIPWIFGSALPWRPHPTPLAPEDADFERAAVWKIELPAAPATPSISDVLLRVAYQGDAARLYRGPRLIDDNFWNGQPWTIGLREVESDWRSAGGVSAFELRILPLPRGFPMYLEEANQLNFNASGEALSLDAVRLLPQYRLVVDLSKP